MTEPVTIKRRRDVSEAAQADDSRRFGLWFGDGLIVDVRRCPHATPRRGHWAWDETADGDRKRFDTARCKCPDGEPVTAFPNGNRRRR